MLGNYVQASTGYPAGISWYVADLNGSQVLRLTAGATPGTLAAAPVPGSYTAPVAIAPEPGNPNRLFVAELAGRVLFGGTPFVE